MKSKIIIVAIIFSIFIGSFTIDTIVDHTRNKSNENKEVSKELADSEMNVIDENENVVIDSNELEQEKQEDPKEPITKDDKIKETSSTTQKTEEKKNVTPKNENNQNEKIQEQPKKEIWEQLGMTKDQYFNKPMYGWEHVDFSVEQYGDESKAKQACLNHGDNYQPYLNGEVSYNCSTVTSASGKYLGEMFYTEKLS